MQYRVFRSDELAAPLGQRDEAGVPLFFKTKVGHQPRPSIPLSRSLKVVI